jgi:dTDP-4-amino-4,6-dideoxygalactose transaminase
MKKKISFFYPKKTGYEINLVKKVLNSGNFNDGKLTKLFEHNNVSDIKIPNVNHDIILNTLRKYSDIVIKSRYINDKY